MSRKTATTKSPTPESMRSVPVPEMPDYQMPGKELIRAAGDYSGGATHALDLGKSSFDAAVCLSACALDIYKNACCFAPALGGYFELGSRLLAACADLQSNYYGMLRPHAEALDAATWGAASCEPAEVLERSMDIAIGALDAHVDFLQEVNDASASFDLLRGSFAPYQQPSA
jgi:hypothetical protein